MIRRGGYEGGAEVIEGLGTASSIRAILAPPSAPQAMLGVSASPLISSASPNSYESRDGVGGIPSRPSRPTDVAALSSGNASHGGYASLQSPEVSVRATAPRYSRGADPPPLVNNGSYIPQASGGAAPARPVSVVPAVSSSSTGRFSGPRVSGGGISNNCNSEPDSSDVQVSGEQAANLTPSLGSGRPSNAQARSFPGHAPSQGVKKANVLSVTASGAPAPLLGSSRSLVPPPARVASSMVPSASRYFSYAPAVVRSSEPLSNKPSSFTPSLSRSFADTSNMSSSEDRPLKFLEGLQRPSPLLAESKGHDPLISSVRHLSTHPRISIEGLSSGNGSHPSVWAYPAKPPASSAASRASAITAKAGPREGPPELGDFRRPESNYSEFVHEVQPDTSSRDLPFEERFPMFFGGKSLPAPFGAAGAVPNTSPPVKRYTVNPKDGCLETTLDTQQPAHVPAVAAAAMAAVTAASSGKNALFPNFADREKDKELPKWDDAMANHAGSSRARVEGQPRSGLQCSTEAGEEDELEQQLKAELDAARAKRAEAVKRLMNPTNN